MSLHVGVRCNACSRSDFPGKRYKCLICYDYDLCEMCYEAQVTEADHKTEHAVQCILTPRDHDLYYGGESSEGPQSFTCPMCATMGFSLVGLREHVTSLHAETHMQVVCPVCAATAGGHPNNITGALALHLASEHARNRDVLYDQTASGRLQRVSSTGAGGATGRSARSRRPQIQFSSAVSFSQLPPRGVDSIAGVLSQISTEARRTSAQLVPGGTGTDVQPLQMTLQVARQEMQTAIEPQDRPLLRDHFSAGTSVYSLPLPRFPTQISVRPQPNLVVPPAPDDPRFLLNSLVEEDFSDSQQQELEVERANRSLFVQELLLRTLEEQAPAGAGGQRWESNFSSDRLRGAEQNLTMAKELTTASTLEKTATPSLKPFVSTSCPITSSPDPNVVASQEGVAASCLAPTATGSLEVTPTTNKALPLPVRSSHVPTSTPLSGRTATAVPIAASSGKIQSTSGGSTTPSSTGTAAASSISPTEASTIEPTVRPTP